MQEKPVKKKGWLLVYYPKRVRNSNWNIIGLTIKNPYIIEAVKSEYGIQVITSSFWEDKMYLTLDEFFRFKEALSRGDFSWKPPHLYSTF